MVQPLAWHGGSATEWVWAHSRNGQTLDDHGQSATALLPRDDTVVLVLPVCATSWQRVVVPKINPARLRQALDGLLEERLLADPAHLHLALQPNWHAGQAAWVLACDKAKLHTHLATLHAAGRPVSRIVPDLSPTQQTHQHALVQDGQPWLVDTGPLGVLPLPLGEHTAATPSEGAIRLAEPACAAMAEAAVGQPFATDTPAQRLLRSSQGTWNAAQFDLRLSAGARRGQRLREGWRQFAHAPAWRPTRWGLALLLASGVVGLNALAWQDKQALQAKQLQAKHLLTGTFPSVSLVLDAPLQMQRELATLQRSSGQLGQGDVEQLLAHFSALSLDGIGLSAIHFTSHEARLTLTQATDANVTALREGLRAHGWQSQYTAPVLTLTPGAAPLSRP
jgi:general secretion pathway protein L